MSVRIYCAFWLIYIFLDFVALVIISLWLCLIFICGSNERYVHPFTNFLLKTFLLLSYKCDLDYRYFLMEVILPLSRVSLLSYSLSSYI